MKKLFLISAAIIGLASIADAHNIDPNTVWTDGSTVYVLNVAQTNATHLDYVGGTLHEGGYAFGLDRVNGKYVISASRIYDFGSDEGYTSFGPESKIDYEVTLERIGGRQLLVARDSKGTITDVLEDLDGELYDKEVNDQYVTYAGDYKDYKGNKWSFGTDGTITMPGKKAVKYKIMDMYDMPSNIITVDDGKSYMQVEMSTTGLNIYKCDFNPEIEDASKGGLIAKLRRTASPYGDGLCPYTSKMLINPSLIGCYDNDMLRIIRNEIWARHGYRFSSADLQQHFAKQAWYKPVDDNAAIELSELEKMNIAIIKSMESRERDWMDTEKGY